jgi:hypothetical protein
MIAIEPPEGSLQGARSHQPVEVGPKQPGQRFKATQVAPGSQRLLRPPYNAAVHEEEARMSEPLAELQKLREELVARRSEEAREVKGAHDDERIKTLGHLHLAIEALDAVIAKEPASNRLAR